MRRSVRWLLPAVLVLVWLFASATGGPYFGRLAEVQSQSVADFLPATAESTRVSEIQRALSEDAGIPAILLYTRADGFDAATQAVLSAQLNTIRGIAGVVGASPLLPSTERNAAGDPVALEAFVLVEGAVADVVAEIRAVTAETPEGIDAYVTGPGGFAADLTEAFGGIDGILLLVAVAAVLVILLIVYRSPILPILVLFSAISALSAAVVAVYLMADAGWILLNGQAQGILFILVVGAATDYALLLVSRYREALREEERPIRALIRAWRGVVEPILASAGTVIAGLLCLLISDLNSNKALGPVAAVGIVFAVLASLTFLPALLALIGRPAFWPATPHRRARNETAHRGFWARLAGLVQRRPRMLWLTTTAVLVLAAAFVPTLKATGVPQTDIILGESEAVDGQDVLGRYFSIGAGTPVIIIAPAADAPAVLAALQDNEDLADVATEGNPATVEGREIVEIRANLAVASDSDEALAIIEQLRASLQAISADVLVGGSSATALDSRDTATRDLYTIVPLVLVVITLILIVLLRSILAPVLLIATTLVSYLGALGLAALVFDHIFHFPGADPAVPLFAFVFLVALGIDYNIFLTTRIREEALRQGTRPGILAGLTATGGVITSAGIVLAATFAALAVIPILFLAQIAFIVASGVLIDAILVRSILVPGLLYDIGPRIWWPSRKPGAAPVTPS